MAMRAISRSNATAGPSPPAPDADITLPKLLVHQAGAAPDAVAMREKKFGIWRGYTWRDYRDEVRALFYGLKALKLERGQTLAVIGRNRPNWVWAELAAHSAGAMSIGLYEDVLVPEAAYLIKASRAEIVVCEDEEQVDKMLAVGADLPIRHIVYHDDRGMRKYADPRLVPWDDLRAKGAALAKSAPDLFEAEIAKGKGEEVAILCTTSGTTSHPKLAMLQHRPFLTHLKTYLDADPRGPDDEYVCVLPLSWIMEQVYVVGMPLLSRIRVNFPESVETAMADLREIGPTHLLLAPRVWEQTAADMRARVMDANRVTRGLFDWGVGRAIKALEAGGRDPLADALVMAPLRDRLGFSRVASAATGGAALGPDTFKFFLAMGVPLRQLYGQTELCGAYTLQRGGAIDTDTSGLPFEGTQLRIRDPDDQGVGEIETLTPGMFKGYFEDEAATAATLSEDGWMETGDAGYLDDQGRLVVLDRMKDLAATSSGHRFSPQFIENRLKFSPYIGECVVLGNDRPYLAAIVCVRYGMAAKWAEARQIGFTNYQNLSANPEVYDLIAAEVEAVNARLPAGQRIGRFLLLYKELDPDDGELTRTRKVRRGVIDARYGGLIEALYGNTARVRSVGEITFEDGRKGRVEAEMAIRDTTAAKAGVLA